MVLHANVLIRMSGYTIICIPVNSGNGRGFNQKWVGLTGSF